MMASQKRVNLGAWWRGVGFAPHQVGVSRYRSVCGDGFPEARESRCLVARGWICATVLGALLAVSTFSPPTAAQIAAGVTVDPTSVVFHHGEDRLSYRIRLSSRPSEVVEITATPDGYRHALLEGTAPPVYALTLSFSPGAWNEWQTVWLTRLGAGSATGGSTIFSHSTSSSDSSYNGIAVPSVTVEHNSRVRGGGNVFDFSPRTFTIDEDETGSYNMRLRSDPGTGITVVATPNSGNDLRVTHRPASLSFTGGSSGNWNSYQAVTITPVPDADSNDDTVALAHSVSGLPGETQGGVVGVTIVDTISPGLVFTPASVTVLDEIHSTYQIMLATRPSREVAVTGKIVDARVVTTRDNGVPSASFVRVFTPSNWNIPQSAELHYGRDGSTTVTHTSVSSDAGYKALSQNLSVTATTPATPRAVLAVSSTSVDEGDALTVTVNLRAGNKPGSATVIPIVYTNGSAEAADYTSVASVTVPANGRSGSATVTIADDDVYEAAETFTLALGTLPAGIRPPLPSESSSHEVTIAGGDKPEVSVSAGSATIDEGAGADFVLALSNPADKDITIDFTVSEAGGHVGYVDSADKGTKSYVMRANAVSHTYTVDSDNLAADNPDGSVALALTAGSDYTIASAMGSASTLIADTDATTVVLSAPDGDISETSGSKQITLTLGRGLVEGESLSLPLTIGGTAALGADYTLSAPDTLPAGVTYATLGSAPTITFTGGGTPSSAVATLTLSATADTLDEGASETITIALPDLDEDSGTGLSGGASDSGSVSFAVTDDDDAPVVSITGPAQALTEGDTASYQISIAGESADDLSIGFTIGQTGNFVATDDLGTKSLSLASGVNSLGHSVATVSDTSDEPGGSLTVTLNAGSGYTVDAGASSVTVDVTDDDATSVTLSTTAGDISETNGSKTITVAIGRGLVAGESLTLPLATGGTAELGTDYTLAAPSSAPSGVGYATLGSSPTITFTGGSTPTATSATLALAATSDDYDEGTSESVTIELPTLNSSSGSGLDGGASGTGSVSFAITDDDAVPVVTLARTGTGAITEGGSVTFTIDASNPSARDLSVGLTVSQQGAFLAADDVGPNTLAFAPGDTRKIYTITTVSDLNDEAQGGFTVALATPVADAGYTLGATSSIMVEVDDDDATLVTLDVPSTAISETNGSKTITVTLERPLVAGESLPVSVRFSGSATFGDDYTVSAPGSPPTGVTYGAIGSTTTITFTGASGGSSTSATLTAGATGDSINEGASETVSVALGALTAASGTGLQGGARGTGGGSFQITDDDSASEVSIAGGADIVEGGSAQFTISSTVASSTATTVNLSVSATGAFVASGALGAQSVIIPAGQTQAVYPVATQSDADDEVGGEITVAIASGNGYSISNTAGSDSVMVSDDDPTTVSLAATDSTATEGSSTETAAFTVALGRALVGGESLTVPIAVTGIASNEYTLSLTSATGIGLTGNALTFTGGAGAATTATVVFRALAETDATDLANEAVGISIPASSASGTPRMTATGLDGGATGSGSANIAITDTSVSAPGVTPSSASLPVDESGSASYTVVLDTDPGQSVTITPSSDNADVTLSPTFLDFTGGASGNWNTPRTFTVSAAADGDATNDSATITHAITGYGGVTVPDVSVTVADAGHGFVVEPPSLVVEAGSTATYTVRTLSEATRQLVLGASSDGDAIASVPSTRQRFDAAQWQTGVDITVTGVAAGQTTVRHTNFTATADSVYGREGSLTVPPVSVTVTASSAPLVSISASSASVSEGTNAEFTVSSSIAASSGGLVVNLASVETGDFVSGAVATSVTIAEGDTSAVVTVATANDSADELNGELTLSIATSTDYRVQPGQSSAAVSLLDDDATGVTLSGSGSIAETAGEQTITVTLSRSLLTSEVLAVPLSFSGTASFGTDYTLAVPATVPAGISYQNLSTATPSITFTGGPSVSATATLRVLASSDTAEENDETVTVALGTLDANSGTNLGGGASGSGTASFTIGDDDGSGPTISIEAGTAIQEGGNASFTVRADSAPANALVVNLNVGQTGAFVAARNLQAKTVTIAATDTMASYTVATVGDSRDEPDGAVTVTVTSGADYSVSNTAGSAEIVVSDDDSTSVTLSAPAGAIDEEGGSKEITVGLGRSLATGERLSVPLDFGGAASFGGDYALAAPSPIPSGVSYSNLASTDLSTSPPTILFTGGPGASASATLSLTATGDSDVESAETITLGLGTLVPTGLSGGASGSGSVSFSIADDDDPSLPTVSVTAGAGITEGGNASFELAVDPAAHPTLVVYYTVSQGGSYVASGSLGTGKSQSLGAGAGTAPFTIPTSGDSDDEPDGAVTVTLAAHGTYNISATRAAASVTVDDNDPTGVTLSAQSGNIPETNGTKIVRVALERALVSGEVLPVPLTFGGAASFGSDYELSEPDTAPSGVTYSNLASGNLGTNPPTLTFTGGSGASATATLLVEASHDIEDEGSSETVTVGLGALGSSSGTDLSGGASGSGTASFSITDDDGTPVISISGGIAVTEGGDATFTLSANPPPQQNISVALEVTQDGVFVAASNLGTGKSVPIATSGTSAMYTVSTVNDTTDEASGSVSVRVVTGSGYTPSADAGVSSVDVMDDDETVATLSISDASATELDPAQTATFAVSLNRALVAGERLVAPLTFAGGVPGTDFELALTPTAGAAFDSDTRAVTFTAGGSAASLVFTALLDADESDDTVTVDLGTLTATGLDGGASGVRQGNGAISIIDAGAQPAVDVSTTTVAVTEGGSDGSYRVRLHTDPGGSVTVTPVSADTGRLTVSGPLTFNSSTWESWQTVTVTPGGDGDISDDDVMVTHDVTGYGSVDSGPQVTVSVVDRGRGVTVEPGSVEVAEEATATYRLVLDSQPSHDVTITPTSAGESTATVGAAVTFTPSRWNQPQSVQVTGVNSGATNITHDVSSTDTDYAAVVPAAVSVSVTAIDRVLVSSTSITAVEHGADATYTVRLNTDPGTGVTVTPTTTSSKISIDPGAVTFNSGNWSEPRTFTVSAAEDGDTNDETAVIAHRVTGYGGVTMGPSIDVVVDDAGVQVIASETSITLTQGGAVTTFDVFVTSPPTGEYAIFSGDSHTLTDGGTGTTFRFNTAGSRTPVFTPSITRVTVAIVGLRPGTGKIAFEFSSSVDPRYHRNLELPVIDITTVAAERVNVTPTRLNLDEGGGDGSYDVTLNTNPGATVTVTPSSSDTGAATFSPATLAFDEDDWNMAQTVTVSPVDDADRNDESVVISHAVSGYTGVSTAPSVDVRIGDDDKVPEISISADSSTVTEGGGASFTVSSDFAPASELTVHLSLAQTGNYVAGGDIGTRTVAIAATETSATFTVDTLEDSADEAVGSLTATLTADPAYTIAAPPNDAASVELQDNDATGVVLGVPAGNIDETSGSKTLTLDLDRALVSGEVLPVEVNFSGAATRGTDYSLVEPTSVPSGLSYALGGTTPTVTFTGPSPVSASFTFEATHDDLDEGDGESVSISLGTLDANSGTDLHGGASGSGSGTFVITDDDDPAVPEVGISAAAGVTEGMDASFTVSASYAPAANLVVRLNVSQDGAFVDAGNLGPATVTIGAGESSATFTVPTQGDTADKVSGSVTVTVTADAAYTISAAAGAGEAAIADDDATSVTLAGTDSEATEGDANDPAGFTVTLGRGLVSGEVLAAPLSFSGGAAGQDFSLALTSATGIAFAPSTSTLTFTGGAGAVTTATLTLTALDDQDAVDESVSVSLGALTPTGLDGGADAQGSASISIIDDESSTPTISVEAGEAVEEGTNLLFTVKSSRVLSDALVVDLTITQTRLYVRPGNDGDTQVAIQPGQSSATVRVLTDFRLRDEPSGVVTLTANDGDGYVVSTESGSAEWVVVDTNRTGLRMSVSDTTASEGDSDATAEIQVTVDRQLVSGERIDVPLAATGGVPGEDFSLALDSSSDGSATWSADTSTLTFTGSGEDFDYEFGGGSISATLTLTASDDADADDERVTFGFGTITTAGIDGGTLTNTRLVSPITITDDDEAPLSPVISISGDGGVTEGLGAGFTVTATPAPSAGLVVNLSVSQQGDFVSASDLGANKTVTIGANQTSADYDVSTQPDALDEPDGSVTVTVTSGSDYTVSSSAGSGTVAVADDDATDVTLAVTDATATEGDASATAEFTVTLGRALVDDEGLTAALTFAGGTAGQDFDLALGAAAGISFAPATSTLTFTGGGGVSVSVATLTLTPAVDADGDDETVTVSLGTLTPSGLGGGVNGSRTGNGQIVITDAGVADPVISISGDGGVTEGSGAGFTVTATPAPSAGLVVNLSVSQQGDFVSASDLGANKTVTIGANQTSADYDVSTQPDALDEPDGSVTVTVTSGSDYTVSSSAGSDDVVIADDDSTSVILEVTDDSATEGDASATVEFTVTLGRALASGEGLTVPLAFTGGTPGQDFTLTLAAATGIRFAPATNTLVFSGGTGAVSVATLTLAPAADNDVADESVTVSLGTVTPIGLGGGTTASRTGNGQISITDAGVQAGVLIADSPVSVTEGGATARYTVVLATNPGTSVTVTPVSSDISAVTVSGALSFTSSNWDDPQPVIVTPVADGDIVDETVTITHTVTGYPDVTSAPDASVGVLDRGRGVTVNPTTLSLNEGVSANYRVVLLSQPTNNVVIVPASGSPATATIGPPITFTPSDWDEPQDIAVTGVDAGTAIITHGVDSTDVDYAAITPSAVSATVAAVPSVEVSAPSIPVTERGADGSYTVVLGTNPGGEVQVTPSSSDTSAVTVSGALNFNAGNWSTPQRVILSPQIDSDAVSEAVTVSHGVTGYPGVASAPSVSVNVSDFGHAILVDPTQVSVPVGETASYAVTITSAPASRIDVLPGSASDAIATVGSGVTLTASQANSPATITVTGVSEGQTTISHRVVSSDPNYGGGAVTAASITVNVTPAESVRITPVDLSLTEGGGDGSYRVVLGTNPGGSVTVTPTSGDPGAATVSGALTFDASTWNEAQTITVSPVDDADADDETLTILHAVSGYPGVTNAPAVAVAVNDDDRIPTVSVTAAAAIAEGGNAIFRVSATPAPQSDLDVSLTVAAAEGAGAFVAQSALGSATVTIAAGADFANYTLGTDDDSLDEPNGSLTATLAAGSGYLIAAAPDNSVNLVVNDNDATGVTLSGPAEDISEAGGSAVLTVVLDRGLEAGESLPVGLILTGTALLGTDYRLSAPDPAPAGVVYRSLDSAPVIAFTGGAGSSASATLTLTAVDDDLDEGDSESLFVALAALDSASGTGLGGGAAGSGSASFEILDDDELAGAPVVSISEGPAVTERGGVAVFSISANPAPSGALEVGLRVSESGSVLAASELGSRSVILSASQPTTSLSVPIAADDVDEPNGAVSVTLDARTGYTVSQAAGVASVDIYDDDATSVTLSAPAGNIAENGSKTIRVALGRALVAPESLEVTLILGGDAELGTDYRLAAPGAPAAGVSHANLDSAPAITFTGGAGASATTILTLTAIDDVMNEGDSESVSIALGALGPMSGVNLSGGATGSGNPAFVILDDDADEPAALAVSAEALSVAEGGDASFTVNLATQPTDTVTVAIAGAAGTDLTLDKSSLQFTAANWDAAQTVTVSAGEDDDATDDTATLTLTAAGDGYASISARVVVSVADADEPAALAVSAEALSVAEGGDASFTVNLATQPTDTVIVAIAGAAGTDLTLDKSSLQFTAANWDAAQTVTVSAGEDDDATDDTATLTLTAAGDGYASISARVVVSVADADEPAALAVSAEALSVAEGGDASFTVNLATQPTDTVTVAIAGAAGTDLTLDKSSLQFTAANWDAAQTVTVSAGEDDDATDDTATLTLTAAGDGYASISARVVVSVADADEPAALAVSAEALSVAEGGDASFTVNLATQPTDTVTVAIAGAAGTDLTLDKSSLQFTAANWDAAQTVTVSAGEDDDATDDTATLTLTAAGDGYASISARVVVSVADADEPAALAVSAEALSVAEGGDASFTVNLATQPTDTVTVAIAGAAGTDLTLDKSSLQFTAANWDAAQTVTVSAGEDDDATDDTATLTLTAAGDGYASISARVVVSVTDTDEPPNYDGLSAWLPRFGRSVAEQVVDTVSGRWEAARTPGFEGRVAGASLSGAAAVQEDEPDDWRGGLEEDGTGPEEREILAQSDFTLTGEADDAGGSYALWARVSDSNFAGAEDGLTLGGEVLTGLFGADLARGDWLAGAALTHSEGEGRYTLDGGTGGAVETALTALAPYGHLRLDGSRTVWGVLGLGQGTLTLTPEGGAGISAGVGWRMAAAGARDALIEVPVGGGLGLSAKSDVLWARTTSESVPGLEGVGTGVRRLRAGLEGTYTQTFDGGATLVPKLEAGLRHDAGDAEIGWGVELGGGLAWTDPASGLDLSVEGRGVATHADGAFSDRSYAAAFSFDPRPDTGRGLALSLTQSAGGASSGGVEALFTPGPPPELGDESAAGPQWTAEAAYGLPAFGARFTGAPFVRREWSDTVRDTSLGWRLAPERPDLSFDLDLKATRRESDGEPVEHGVGFELRMRW